MKTHKVVWRRGPEPIEQPIGTEPLPAFLECPCGWECHTVFLGETPEQAQARLDRWIERTGGHGRKTSMD